MSRSSLLAAVVFALFSTAATAADKPNVIFILADDLAQGDLGCYGQKKIKTPNLDRMAKEGMRFTQAYSGTSVCAPSRASLMTGLHMGHCPIRANREVKPEGQKPLPEGTFTVAKLLKDNGYATACAGKWGMGMFDSPGSPLKVGFDHFFGYNCQRHAHSYFPPYLYNDDKRIPLDGKTYSINLIQKDVLGWVQKNKDKPFFLFYAATLPHGKYEIDDLGEYAKTDWTTQQKTYAAMVSRLDRDVGELIGLLKKLKLDEKTIIFFVGDNGSSFAPDSPIGKFFAQANGLRGHKRSMYEGGLRQAALVRWPGKISAGKVSDVPWAFWDFLPTCAELSGTKLPEKVKTDGVSIVPLLGKGTPKREAFYWELHEGGGSIQAVRFGDWKAVRNGPSAAIELYDLKSDPGERKDLAKSNPDVVKKAAGLLKSMREDDPAWPLKDRPKKKGKGKVERKTKVEIKGEKFLINGQPTYKGRMWKGKSIEGLLFNSRMVQATFDDLNPKTRDMWAYPDTKKWDPDRNTREFLAMMPQWRKHGLLAFTINLQGGSPQGYSKAQPWHNSALKDDGSLRPAYMARFEKILDRADELGMVVILGIYYFGQDERLKDENAVKAGVDATTDWLIEKKYTNVLIEINNECNVRYDHAVLKPDRVHELIERARKRAADQKFPLLVSTSYGGGQIPRPNVVKSADFLLLHGNGVKDPARVGEMVRQTRKVKGYRPMPILFNEDDHFDFDKPKNNFLAAVETYASWGYFDYRMKGEGFGEGYQSVPVNWKTSSERKKGFFKLLSEITGEKP